jgi:hypothetical protein
MLCLNAAVLWNNRKDIAAARNRFSIFYSNAQMVHEGGLRAAQRTIGERKLLVQPDLPRSAVSPLNMRPEANCPQKVTIWRLRGAWRGGELYVRSYVYILQ